MFSKIWIWLGCNTAEIIAVCALVFTAYQAYLSRRHNRLSIIPKLTTSTVGKSEESIGSMAVILANNGLGPAVINTYLVELDGIPQEFNDSSEVLVFMKELVGNIGVDSTVTLLNSGHIIAAGESTKVMFISFVDNEGKGSEYVDNLMNRFSLRVSYSSIYGEKFEYHSIETHS